MRGRPLGTLRRRRDKAYLDLVFCHEGRHLLGAVHFEAVNDFTNLEGIAVEDAHDVEIAGTEVAMVEQGLAEVANADEGHLPLPVHIEGRGDGCQERDDFVAHAAYAEFAEVSEIFANLRTIYSAGLSQGNGGDDFRAFPRKVFEHLDVDGQTADGGAGDVHAFGGVHGNLLFGRASPALNACEIFSQTHYTSSDGPIQAFHKLHRSSGKPFPLENTDFSGRLWGGSCFVSRSRLLPVPVFGLA